MVRRGTVVNGVIVLEGPSLPEGTLVRVEHGEEGLFTDETHDEFIESLRQSIADTQSGVPGYSHEEVMAAVDDEIRKVAERKKSGPHVSSS